MTAPGLIGAFATIWLGGTGLALAIMARAGRVSLPECLCFGWLFGVGLVSLLLWAGSAVSSGLPLQLGVTICLLICAAVGYWQFQRHRTHFVFPRPRSIWEWVLSAVLVLEVAAIFYGTPKHTLGWDGLLVWEIKARYAFLNNGVLPSSYLAANEQAFSHPDYPLGLPLTQLWIYLWIGEANQFWAKAIFPVFYAVGAILLALFGARLTRSRVIGLSLACLLFFVPQVSVATGGSLVGYADLPLAIYYLATIGALASSLRGSKSSFALFGLTLALLPWIKREGTVLWAVAAFAGIIVLYARRRPAAAWLCLLPGFALMLSWKLFLYFVSATRSLDFGSVSFSALREHGDRMVPILGSIATEMSSASDWGIFWAVLFLAILVCLWQKPKLATSILLITIVLPLALYAASYIFSAWPVYLDHVNSSSARLLMQVVPVSWLLIGAAAARAGLEPPSAASPAPPATRDLARF